MFDKVLNTPTCKILVKNELNFLEKLQDEEGLRLNLVPEIMNEVFKRNELRKSRNIHTV